MKEEQAYASLGELEKAVAGCERCALSKTRARVVFGRGSETPAIVFVGEAPGEREDIEGRPFVGRAGKLLDTWLLAAGFPESFYYIMNTLKCRPPGNRDPLSEEKRQCLTWFNEQIRLLSPRLLCGLGKHGFSNLVPVDAAAPFSRYRLQTHEYQGVPVIATYHPSYILRSPNMRAKIYEDFVYLFAVLGKTPPKTLSQIIGA